MHLFRFAFLAVAALSASPVRAEDKPAGEQFQFQADVNKLMVRERAPPSPPQHPPQQSRKPAPPRADDTDRRGRCVALEAACKEEGRKGRIESRYSLGRAAGAASGHAHAAAASGRTDAGLLLRRRRRLLPTPRRPRF